MDATARRLLRNEKDTAERPRQNGLVHLDEGINESVVLTEGKGFLSGRGQCIFQTAT